MRTDVHVQLVNRVPKDEQRETEEAGGLAHKAESLRNRTENSLVVNTWRILALGFSLLIISGYDFAEVQIRDNEA
jgi:hypothetical protein